MKLIQIINERTENEVIIQRVGEALGEVIANKIINDDLPSRTIGDQTFYGNGRIGELKDIVGSKILGPLFSRLGRVKIETYHAPHIKEGGDYSRNDGAVIRFNVAHYPNGYGGDEETIRIATKTAIHELKHALDDSLSGRQVTSKEQLLRSPNKYSDRSDRYLTRQTEINARLSEALHDMERQIVANNITDKQQIGKIILRTLHKYQLSEIFSDRSNLPLRGMYSIFGRDSSDVQSVHPMENSFFRKLVNRMYKFATRRR